jgi:hypothetical protein
LKERHSVTDESRVYQKLGNNGLYKIQYRTHNEHMLINKTQSTDKSSLHLQLSRPQDGSAVRIVLTVYAIGGIHSKETCH